MTSLGYRRLILSRHAKSAWDDPLMDDLARPLNDRGRRAAHELGDWLASRGYDPEEVLCSTAIRTQETWQRAAQATFETRPKLRFEQALYDASAEIMLQVLQGMTLDTVMLIGHNPGIAELAAILAANPPVDPNFRRFPTAATLVVDFQIDAWSDLRAGTGSVLDFTRFDGRY